MPRNDSPRYCWIATCTKFQYRQYAPIEWPIAQGMFDRRIYAFGVKPIAPTGYALVVMADENIEAELPTLYPGVTDWLAWGDAKPLDSARPAKPFKFEINF